MSAMQAQVSLGSTTTQCMHAHTKNKGTCEVLVSYHVVGKTKPSVVRCITPMQQPPPINLHIFVSPTTMNEEGMSHQQISRAQHKSLHDVITSQHCILVVCTMRLWHNEILRLIVDGEEDHTYTRGVTTATGTSAQDRVKFCTHRLIDLCAPSGYHNEDLLMKCKTRQCVRL